MFLFTYNPLLIIYTPLKKPCGFPQGFLLIFIIFYYIYNNLVTNQIPSSIYILKNRIDIISILFSTLFYLLKRFFIIPTIASITNTGITIFTNKVTTPAIRVAISTITSININAAKILFFQPTCLKS